MKMEQIREKAADLGVIAGNMKKDELIRAIQRAEGHNTCFGTGSEDCPYLNCCFRADCLKKK